MELNSANVILKVRLLAKRSPDALYLKAEINLPGQPLGCSYTKGKVLNHDGCGCLIGQAIVLIDPTFNFSTCDAEINVYGLFERCSIPHTKRELHWLAIVQDCQDQGHRWSKCIEVADKAVNLTEGK